jgi:hypothetical protein
MRLAYREALVFWSELLMRNQKPFGKLPFFPGRLFDGFWL